MTIRKYVSDSLERALAIVKRLSVAYPPLNDYEKTIVYKYTDDGFEDLNAFLRKYQGQENNNFYRLFSSVLGKMPNNEGYGYRGVNLTKIEVDKYIAAFEQ